MRGNNRGGHYNNHNMPMQHPQQQQQNRFQGNQQNRRNYAGGHGWMGNRQHNNYNRPRNNSDHKNDLPPEPSPGLISLCMLLLIKTEPSIEF